MTHSTRRDFLKTAGCLTIGFSLFHPYGEAMAAAAQELPGSLRRYPDINAWLQVLEDGRVRVLTGKIELGQGLRTAVAQVAAEELELGMEQVSVTLAETGVTPNEGYTAGSMSIETSAMAIRHAAAAARQQLLALAAEKLQAPAARLEFAGGRVSMPGGRRSLTFAEILDGRELSGTIRLPLPLKAKQDYTLSGRSIPRQDTRQIVAGAPVYVHDLRFPGMLHARVVRPPAYQAKLLGYNEQAVRAKAPDLVRIVVNGSFLGVIAPGEYAAIQAQEALAENARWSDAPPLAGGDALPAYLATLPVRTEKVREKGQPISGGASLQATYFKPYIMHGATGPSCAVALYDKDQLHVWTHSQGVYPLQGALAEMLELPAERIHVKGVPGSGCYGHNGADDVAAEAALFAMALPGRHVRLQWSRQDEHGWEPYGSAMLMDTAAVLDAGGRITHWQYELRSDTHSTRPGGKAGNLLPARYLEKPFRELQGGYNAGAYRNAEPYYDIPNQHLTAHFFEGPLRVSALRSLGAYANIFAIESFMDELAEKAGKDPYDFRLMHLEDKRAIAVLQKLRDITPAKAPHPGSGIGIAFARYKNSAAYCATAAQVRVDDKGGRVEKMWAAIDAGEAINPGGIINQTEGGMVQAASWTLMEQVRFDAKHVTSNNWYTYPMLQFGQAPATEVAVIQRPEERALGAGEAVQGPAAAAIANAVYHACGIRVRELPILPGKLKQR
ncbi:molybdopterin cofactor-binding domain-containing protein [Chitinophaga japonensis]|uniref:CO/xanthine dehydrogenase Mo-binding subunit n=1 Tax=Chitinophaga japonensis TaxID=104662 RepID=A0A562TF38_CHIJA|nr:molybdopterin cofactor-binding domain-containing protein [Chitinophaga japonensis]TWI92149.1 CO/xanthine dehydrogenase Mo-binding subunit [Chitinophaga japonensis]